MMQLAKDIHNYKIEWEDVKHREGKKLYLSALVPIIPHEGYGIFSMTSVLELEKRGVSVQLLNDVDVRSQGILAETFHGIVELLHRDKVPTRWSVTWGYPFYLEKMPTPNRVLSTMFECTQIPDDWDKHMPLADQLIVPAPSQVDIFRNSGYDRPIHIVPIGVDVSSYQYVERPPRDTFTFVSWARMSSRKMPHELLQCFWKAFPGVKDVRLVMKTRNHDFGLGSIGIPKHNDSRITIIDEEWPTSKLVDLAHQADCGVFLSHGEGWFMPPLQAMATGLPVIAPSHSGCSGWADPKYTYIVGLDPKRPTGDAPLGTRGGKPLQWWNPSLDETVAWMRHVYENRDEAAAKGKASAEYVRKKFNEKVMVDELVKVLGKLK
jgi:glycosyltransferase involved in cell wall biosynthesis